MRAKGSARASARQGAPRAAAARAPQRAAVPLRAQQAGKARCAQHTIRRRGVRVRQWQVARRGASPTDNNQTASPPAAAQCAQAGVMPRRAGSKRGSSTGAARGIAARASPAYGCHAPARQIPTAIHGEAQQQVVRQSMVQYEGGGDMSLCPCHAAPRRCGSGASHTTEQALRGKEAAAGVAMEARLRYRK